jgi:hypothetical protein
MNTFSQDLGDVFWPERLLNTCTFDAVLEHSQTERAVGQEDRGAGSHGHFHPSDIDPLTDLLLGENTAAAGAAAERLSPVFIHLDQPAAGRGDQLARRFIDIVVPAEITGIVIGAGQFPGIDLQFSGTDQCVEKLRIAFHREIEAEDR